MTLPKPKVPWKTRLGTVGESAIKTQLAYFSIPTRYETDPGLDFYCELIEDDSPTIPFYVQAKGTEHFDDCWGRGIPKSTITYWLQQQSPVFLVVYDENATTCYWMSIEDHRYDLIEKMFTTDSDTIYVKVDRSNALEHGKDGNDAFIRKLKGDLNSLRLFRGQSQFIGEEYVKRVPPRPRSDVELLRIKENIRANMYSLVQYCLATDDLETAESCCEFLARFDRCHYNHFVWLGHISKDLAKTERARRSFEEALRICRADKMWPQDSMKEIIASIEEELQSL